jgi:SAM-dependent methyltransferase
MDSPTTQKPLHSNYAEYSIDMIGRLDGPFGLVEATFADRIAPWIAGKSVLDIGCGFGSLTYHLQLKDFRAVGIDMLRDFIDAGKARYPAADLRVVQDATFPFPDKSFDTIVLKDTIHHILAEGDLPGFLQEVKRVCRKRIIVMDPNPMFILRIARWLIGHIDAVCTPTAAQSALENAGFAIRHAEFHEVLVFPLSGGYVGRALLPRALTPAAIRLDRILLDGLRLIGLDRHLCWRYSFVGDLP